MGVSVSNFEERCLSSDLGDLFFGIVTPKTTHSSAFQVKKQGDYFIFCSSLALIVGRKPSSL